MIRSLLAMTAVAGVLLAPPAHASGYGPIFTRVDNGQTITLHTGQSFMVSLASVYWDPAAQLPPRERVKTTSIWVGFVSSDPAVVTQQGPVVYTSTPAATDGKFFLSSAAADTAARPGTVTVTAWSVTRYLCGAGVDCPYSVVLNRFAVTFAVQGGIQ